MLYLRFETFITDYKQIYEFYRVLIFDVLVKSYKYI